MHLYELLACLALISSVLVCVVLHFHGIYQELGFGLAPFRWDMENAVHVSCALGRVM